MEVGDWEHECCGPAYQRDTVVDLTCLVVPGQGDVGTRYLESHHDLDTGRDLIHVRGRLVELRIQHPDGSGERIERLPSGRALRGFDDADDGHLEQPWTGAPVTRDSDRYLLTVSQP